MAVSDEYLEFIQNQLSTFSEVNVKRMFGGVGLFKEGLMFGKIADNVFRLKVDSHNQSDYEERGMKPFFSKSKKKGMPYWEVPEDIIANKATLATWAQKAFDAAVRAKK